ncbi:MAG TPA: rhomboid family intramembrane serine protease [Pyrinomonadaceae bacterium]|jgi:membrane associated rhomboid family serine protease|nr:rhomboid family intramembrane serine protease [Pyrinomonadaceae bacterium]
MCRNCGAIVGSGQQQCAVCGASTTGPAGARQQQSVPGESEAVKFARSVLSRPYKFTIVLLVANIFIFILMWQSSGVPLSMTAPIPAEVLLPFGAKLNSYIYNQHQWWRFVTPMFLHVNLLHVLVNMYSLWIVGPYVEKLYGSAKFVVIWVLTGVAGVVASYLTVRPGLGAGPITGFIFKASDTPSAGASGALFGLVGVLFVFGIRFRRELPEGFKRAFGTGLLPMIVLNLFIGYVLRGFIDNAAHLGGMLSGALLALAIDYKRPGEGSGGAVIWRVFQTAAIALVAVSFIMTARHFRDPWPPELLAQGQTAEPQNPAYVNYAKAMNDAQEAFVVAVQDKNSSNIDAAVKILEEAPSLDENADDLRQRLKALLLRAKEPKPAPATSLATDKKRPVPADQLTLDFFAWRKEYNQWLKTGARNHSGLNDLIQEEPQK